MSYFDDFKRMTVGRALPSLTEEAERDEKSGLPKGVYLRVGSHRARAKVKALLGDDAQEFLSVEDEALYVVSPENAEKIAAAKIKGVSKGRPKAGAFYQRPMNWSRKEAEKAPEQKASPASSGEPKHKVDGQMGVWRTTPTGSHIFIGDDGSIGPKGSKIAAALKRLKQK